ncbi:MAG: hypothetical protein V5B33_15235 [Candidatus Accumulibacter sp. UW20]
MHTPPRDRHRQISEDDLVFIRPSIADHPASSRKTGSKPGCEGGNLGYPWVKDCRPRRSALV